MTLGPRIVRVLADGQPGDALTVAGWVRTRRDSKKGLSFIELNDGSCLSTVTCRVGRRRSRR